MCSEPEYTVVSKLTRIAFSYGLNLKWEFVTNVCYLLFTFHTKEQEGMSLFRRGVISPFCENQRGSSVRFMFLASICNTDSSDLVKNMCGVAYAICQEEKSPRRRSGSKVGTAQLRNNHILRFGTTTYSGSEQPRTKVRNNHVLSFGTTTYSGSE